MSGAGEWTAYALSRDGLNYHDLIEGQPVYDTEKVNKIEGGSRDAYIARSFDGKGYVMVTTDMCVRKSKHWYNYGINLLRSDDLIHWESVTFDFRKGPSIFCDPQTVDVYRDYPCGADLTRGNRILPDVSPYGTVVDVILLADFSDGIAVLWFETVLLR